MFIIYIVSKDAYFVFQPGINYTFVYRLLRDGEIITNGIEAKSPFASVSIDHHVAYGSKCSSQYISTSATISAIKKLVGLKIYGAYHDIRVVKIYLAKMKKENPSARIIDLTDFITAQRHLSSSRARGFASNFQEVLIEGHIPKSAVTLIYRGHKNSILDSSNWIEYEHLWITLKFLLD